MNEAKIWGGQWSVVSGQLLRKVGRGLWGDGDRYWRGLWVRAGGWAGSAGAEDF